MRRLPLYERLRVRTPCEEDWDQMEERGTDRFCARCDHVVHDVASLTRREAEAIAARRERGERVCLNVWVRDADGAILLADGHVEREPARRAAPSRMLAAAAAVAAVTAMTGCSTKDSVSREASAGEPAGHAVDDRDGCDACDDARACAAIEHVRDGMREQDRERIVAEEAPSDAPRYLMSRRRLSLVEHLRVRNACEEDWARMEERGAGRHCARCDHVVHDVASLTRMQAEELAARRAGGERVCLRVHVRRTDGAILVADGYLERDPIRRPPPSRMMVAAVAAATALTACSTKEHASPENPAVVAAATPASPAIPPPAPIETPPEPPPVMTTNVPSMPAPTPPVANARAHAPAPAANHTPKKPPAHQIHDITAGF